MGNNRSASLSDKPLSVFPCLENLSHWHATYVSPRHEKRVAAHLAQRYLEHFLPLYRTVHRWKNGCKAQLELPLFPGYLFVRINRRDRVRVLELPGVISFVGTRGEPAQLAELEIEALRSGLHAHKVEPYRNLAVGQRVRIKAGPLAGLAGVLVRNANGFRVVLTVELIHQSVAVELGADEVEPTGTQPSPFPSPFFRRSQS